MSINPPDEEHLNTDIPGPDLDLSKISEEAMRRLEDGDYNIFTLGEGLNKAVVLAKPVKQGSNVNQHVIISPKLGFGSITYADDDPKEAEFTNLLNKYSAGPNAPQNIGVYTHTQPGAEFHLIVGGSGHIIETEISEKTILEALELNRERTVITNPVAETYKRRSQTVSAVIDSI